MIKLTLLTVLEVASLAVALIYFLFRIVTSLEEIGGTGHSYLAKIRFGVRAIETQTGHLGPQVARLNEGLTTLAGQLQTVDGQLRDTAEALARGKGGAR